MVRLNESNEQEGKMGGIAGKILGILMKLGYLVLQYICILVQWKLRFLKVRVQNWKRCSARKSMESALSDLGSEIYMAHRRGEVDWERMPLVQQQIGRVEESEARVSEIDARIDEINSRYLVKKEEIKQKYADKRSRVGSNDYQDQDYS
jgi:hypothetical protein